MVTKKITSLDWWDLYSKLRLISNSYLENEYDYIFYILKGGMTPAHILSHTLKSQKTILRPLDIKRHLGNEIQSQTITPYLRESIQDDLKSKDILLVEDTIGSGETLRCAFEAIKSYSPNQLDIVSCGIDHQDLIKTTRLKYVEKFINSVFVGFDYWGWMIFPWEEYVYNFQEEEKLHCKISFPNSLESNPTYSNWICLDELNSNWLSLISSSDILSSSAYLSKIICNYDEIGKFIVELYVDAEEPFISPLQLAKYVRPSSGSGIDPWSFDDASVDLVIVRGGLASRIGLEAWRAVAEQIKKVLKPNGSIVFNYLDRFNIKCKEDILSGLEYYTPHLMERMMSKIGFTQDINQSSNEKKMFYRGFKCVS